MAAKEPDSGAVTRRAFLAGAGRAASFVALGGLVGAVSLRRGGDGMIWQIDPFLCTQCGRCWTECVLDESAIKCVHDFDMCGYCKSCFGFFREDHFEVHEGAENQMCPVGALTRRLVEEPYYEYTVDERLCIACGKCVERCGRQGNGSLFLQVRHDRCLNCSECAIAAACPAEAFVRLPANAPYYVKSKGPGQHPDAVRWAGGDDNA